MVQGAGQRPLSPETSVWLSMSFYLSAPTFPILLIVSYGYHDRASAGSTMGITMCLDHLTHRSKSLDLIFVPPVNACGILAPCTSAFSYPPLLTPPPFLRKLAYVSSPITAPGPVNGLSAWGDGWGEKIQCDSFAHIHKGTSRAVVVHKRYHGAGKEHPRGRHYGVHPIKESTSAQRGTRVHKEPQDIWVNAIELEDVEGPQVKTYWERDMTIEPTNGKIIPRNQDLGGEANSTQNARADATTLFSDPLGLC
ncbi:hypothetical protein B0H13DRAFT_1922417 [Mycena leptocephala]|nr:hypothetical protein B0H13DRAFT_1922417 [Mycena leptocephala]